MVKGNLDGAPRKELIPILLHNIVQSGHGDYCDLIACGNSTRTTIYDDNVESKSRQMVVPGKLSMGLVKKIAK